jgi:hypothetical protein
VGEVAQAASAGMPWRDHSMRFLSGLWSGSYALGLERRLHNDLAIPIPTIHFFQGRQVCMNRRSATTWIGTSVLLLGGFLAPGVKAASVSDSEQVSKLLLEARAQAFQLKEDALEMESFSRANVSPASHKVTINQIKDDINILGRQVAKLQAAEVSASPWQRAAIERINPYLDELGGYTTAVIEHLNGDQRRNPAEYRDYLQANADYATDLAAMIDNFIDYGNSRHRVERLGEKLEVAPFK